MTTIQKDRGYRQLTAEEMIKLNLNPSNGSWIVYRWFGEQLVTSRQNFTDKIITLLQRGVWLTNTIEYDAYRTVRDCRYRTKIIAAPKPSIAYNVQDLEKMQMVGVYTTIEEFNTCDLFKPHKDTCHFDGGWTCTCGASWESLNPLRAF